MRRIRPAVPAVCALLTLCSSALAGPLEDAQARAGRDGALVLVVVGADWLPETALIAEMISAEPGHLRCETVRLWAGDSAGEKLGVGVSILDPDGARLLRLETADVLDEGLSGLRAGLGDAARLVSLRQAAAQGALGPDEGDELAALSARAGDIPGTRAALGLAEGETPTGDDALTLAEALWIGDDNAGCVALLGALPADALAAQGSLPRYWLGACRLVSGKTEDEKRQGVADLEAVAGSPSAGPKPRLMAASLLSRVVADPSGLRQLAEIAEQAGPGGAWSAMLTMRLASALPPGVEQEQAFERLASAGALGARLAGLARARAQWPLVAQRAIAATRDYPAPQRMVVVAADEGAFLRELARWDAGRRWPVLLADSWYCRLFLRAYAPERVYYAPPAGVPATDDVYRAAAAALGPEDFTTLPEGGPALLLERTRDGAPGCILWDPADGLGCSAALLAAGRHEPIAQCSTAGALDETASEEALATLARDARRAIAATGRSFEALGDEVDFVTLACDMPYRCGTSRGFEAGVRTTDDCLFRDEADLPQAFVGRLAPDTVYAVYAANCALFLARGRALLFDTYGSNPPWGEYALAPAAEKLPALGIADLTLVQGSEARIPQWLAAQRTPFRWDQVAVNSSGGYSDWSCAPGGMTDDITQVGPCFVSYVHSHAAGRPLDPNALVGRWLNLGCYGFFGSANEPYLDSFRPSSEPVTLLAEGWPAGVAFRRMPGNSYWTGWRLALLGDPLCGLPVRPASGLSDLPLAALDPAAHLPASSLAEAKAMDGDWAGVVDLALQEAPTAARDRMLTRSALVTEMQRAVEAGDAARACDMLRGWFALTGEEWGLPRLADRLAPLAEADPNARAAVRECLQGLADLVQDANVRAELAKRAGAPG